MPGSEQAEKILANLKELGPRRLLALGLIGLITLLLVGGGAYFLSKPQMTVLYSGLDREDITRIGSALQDSGIRYDVNTESSAVLVSHSSASQARMLLAERGLPRGDSAGYELFDNLGSLGLTSFMQEGDPCSGSRGRIGPHDPVDEGRAIGPRAYRAVRKGLVPQTGPEPLGLGCHQGIGHRRVPDRTGHPLSGCRRRAWHEACRGHGAGFLRCIARLRSGQGSDIGWRNGRS